MLSNVLQWLCYAPKKRLSRNRVSRLNCQVESMICHPVSSRTSTDRTTLYPWPIQTVTSGEFYYRLFERLGNGPPLAIAVAPEADVGCIGRVAAIQTSCGTDSFPIAGTGSTLYQKQTKRHHPHGESFLRASFKLELAVKMGIRAGYYGRSHDLLVQTDTYTLETTRDYRLFCWSVLLKELLDERWFSLGCPART